MVNHGITVAELQRFWKAFAGERSGFRAFVRANQIALWKISYFVIASFLFAAAAQKRFSLPQDPLAGDNGYLWPALIRSEEHTSELQSRRDLVCRLLLEKKKE